MRTNRKHKVLTFTFDEWAKIEKLAARCNMKTATFIKTSALKGKVFVIDLKENREYVTALNRIGQNINQIARIANEISFIYPVLNMRVYCKHFQIINKCSYMQYLFGCQP